MSYVKAPEKIPEKGFYYHYKHDPNGPVNNYAYEVMGVGHHTEEENIYFVIYRPLYEEAFVYKNGKMFDARPLAMFMEEVEKDGKRIPRFSKITESELIANLAAIRDKMYAN
ncbi:MAG: DUF1653 domain-containing protein [bacterium]|nr:DUF1653 domain-containing protein [bacterium]